jgi:hypothetical protein
MFMMKVTGAIALVNKKGHSNKHHACPCSAGVFKYLLIKVLNKNENSKLYLLMIKKNALFSYYIYLYTTAAPTSQILWNIV